MTILYEQDVIAWSIEQAGYLRMGRFDLLDIEHLSDEIEDVGKSESRELASRMAVLLCHLLKWHYQPSFRCISWEHTIKEQRKAIARRFKKTPSLKSFFIQEEYFDDAYLDSRLIAEKETGLYNFPEVCPWSMDEILSTD
jgi:hypothetical protein